MTLNEIVTKIRNAILAKDVRESIANGFEVVNSSINEFDEKIGNKDSELDNWMKARESDIAAKEQEHVDLIYDNTLVYSSTKTLTSSDGRSEPGKAFVSNEMEVDCDAIEVVNDSTTICKVMRDTYNVLGTVGPNQIKRIILKDIPKYHIEINSVIPGETSVDLTKIKINKYISVKRANLALPMNNDFMNNVGKRIGSFMASYCVEDPAFMSSITTALPKNRDFLINTASRLPSHIASYCVEDPLFMSSMAAALPKNESFVETMAETLPDKLGLECQKNSTFMDCMRDGLTSRLPASPLFIEELTKVLPSKLAPELVSDVTFQNEFVGNVDLMCSIGLDANVGKAMAGNSMLSGAIASYLPEQETFINSVGRKLAKADSFCSELASSPQFGSAVLLNPLVSLELNKYVPKTTTICGIPFTSNISPSAMARNLAPVLLTTGTFMNDIAELLPSRDTFINNIAEKLPSRLGFFGVYQTITTPNESGKEYFKFADYSIKGKYSINSDRNKINIPRKLLSIKVRGNFSGAESCKNCKICGEVIDENNQIVLSNFEIFHVKAGSDANGLVTEAQPFNAEYILNADLDDSSLGNKTLYIRFYVKYDTMAYFYNIGAWGDCSVTITEI